MLKKKIYYLFMGYKAQYLSIIKTVNNSGLELLTYFCVKVHSLLCMVLLSILNGSSRPFNAFCFEFKLV